MNAKRTSAEIIPMPVSNKRQQYIVDDIFFANTDIVIGTRLRNVGIREMGATWRVVDMHTFKPTGRVGEFRRVRTDEVVKLNDQITLQKELGGLLINEKRKMMFHGLKYSALWRLV